MNKTKPTNKVPICIVDDSLHLCANTNESCKIFKMNYYLKWETKKKLQIYRNTKLRSTTRK